MNSARAARAAVLALSFSAVCGTLSAQLGRTVGSVLMVGLLGGALESGMDY